MSIVTYFSTAVACIGVIGCTTSLEHCWAFPGVLPHCQSVPGDADYQTVAGTEGVAGTGYAKDSDHGFPG